MRIDLVLQSLHSRLQQQAFLLFELDLNTDAIKNFELSSNHHDRSSVNRGFHPGAGALKAERGIWKKAGQLGVNKAQRHDRDKEHNLPVEEAGRRKVAPNPAVNAQINEGRERPDIFLVRRNLAQLPGDESAQHVER